MEAQSISKQRSAKSPLPAEAPSSNVMTAWPEYMVDAFQRSVLFLDLLRQRGNEEIEISSRPTATVLRFEHEVVMTGLSLPRPMNYSLLRILPPRGWRRTTERGRSL